MEGGELEITETFSAGKIGTTLENLRDAAAGEEHEWTEMYPAFSKVAREEGGDQIAAAFDAISIAEKQHGKRLTLRPGKSLKEMAMLFGVVETVVTFTSQKMHLMFAQLSYTQKHILNY